MPVPTRTVESACKIAEWFIDEGKRIYAVFATGHNDNVLTSRQREVMKVLLRVGTALTKDEIKKHSRPCQRLDRDGLLDNILSELVKMKKIQDKSREHSGAGRGTVEYEICDDTERSVITIPQNTDENCNSDYGTPEFDNADSVEAGKVERGVITILENTGEKRNSDYATLEIDKSIGTVLAGDVGYSVTTIPPNTRENWIFDYGTVEIIVACT